MHRTQKASWGFLSGLAFAGITVIVGLVATPLLLRWLGREAFGAFRAASDWTGHLLIFELGVSGALMPLFAQAVGRGDVRKVRAILKVSVRVYLGVTVVMLTAGAGLALVIFRLIPVDPSAVSDLKGGCWVALLALLVIPLSPFRSLAEADQRNYLINCFLIIQALLVTGMGLALAWAGWGITGQFLAASLASVPLLVMLAWDGLRRYRAPRNPEVDPALEADIRRDIWKLNWPSLLRNLSGRVGFYTDNLLIAYFLGPAAVASFFLTQRICALAQTQLQGIGSSGWAGLVELAVKGQRELFHRRLIEMTGLVVVLGIAVMVPLAAFNRGFIALWVGPGCFAGDGVTALAAVNGVVLAVSSLWGLVLSGAGHVRRLAPGTAASAALNITVSIVGTLVVGAPGPLLGTLSAMVFVNSWYFPMLLKRLLQVPMRPLLQAVAMPMAIGIPYAVTVWWFAHAHPPQGWFDLVVKMVGSALLYLAVAWAAIFTSDERAVWRLRLRLLLRPRPAL
jgi:O-antigen/teichoic acid export membrane protein